MVTQVRQSPKLPPKFPTGDPSKATIFRVSNGEIVGWGTYSLNVSHKSDVMGFDSIKGFYDPGAYYVDPKTLTPTQRPLMGITLDKSAIAIGTDTATFSGVPSGVSVSLDTGTAQEVLDGSVSFTAENPGTYQFDFSLFPYIPASFQVTAK